MWATLPRLMFKLTPPQRPSFIVRANSTLRRGCLSSFLTSTKFQSSSKRTFINFLRKPNAEEYRIRDNVSDSFKLIYRNRMDRYIYVLNISILITTIGFIGITIIQQGPSKKFVSYYAEEEKKLKATDIDLLAFSAAFGILAVLTNILVQMLPLRIYYRGNQKKYIYIFQGIMPNGVKKMECNMGQVSKLPVKGVLPWRNQYYRIETEETRRTMILPDDYFRRPGDLHVMLGIQTDPEVED